MAKQKSKQIRVRILNPVPGGQDTTSLAHARRYVRQGRARVIDPQHTIEFIEADHRHIAAAQSVAPTPRSKSPTPLPVVEHSIDSFENLRTFMRYPDDAENAFRKKAA